MSWPKQRLRRARSYERRLVSVKIMRKAVTGRSKRSEGLKWSGKRRRVATEDSLAYGFEFSIQRPYSLRGSMHSGHPGSGDPSGMISGWLSFYAWPSEHRSPVWIFEHTNHAHGSGDIREDMSCKRLTHERRRSNCDTLSASSFRDTEG
jgi:hypothetical protein